MDLLFEPIMAAQTPGSLLTALFGVGKGSGAACFFALLALLGMAVCLCFMRNRHIRQLEAEELKV